MSSDKVFSTLKDPTRVFTLQQLLGSGSYGKVFHALERTSGKSVAVKIMTTEPDEEGECVEVDTMIKEVQLMKSLSYEFVVAYYGAYSCGKEIWIAMEYCEIGSALDVLRILQNPFPEPAIASITKDILAGLVFLHGQKIIHRDLKAGNVLLTRNGRVRLTDFGVSAAFGQSDARKRLTIIGSPFWMAPEVITQVGYSYPSDIWGLGITIIELAEMVPPRSDQHPMKVLVKIPTLPSPKLATPHTFSAAMETFLSYALKKDPAERMSAAQLQKMPFVAQVNPSSVADLVSRGLDVIARFGSREAAMRARDDEDEAGSSGDAPDAVSSSAPEESIQIKIAPNAVAAEEEAAPPKARPTRPKRQQPALQTIRLSRKTEDDTVTATAVPDVASRRKKKKVLKKKSAAASKTDTAPVEAVSSPSGRSSSGAIPLEGAPEVSVCMKKLTRILRSLKAIKQQIEAGAYASKDAAMQELAQIDASCAALSDEPGIDSETCVQALRKLQVLKGKVAQMAASISSVSSKTRIKSKSGSLPKKVEPPQAASSPSPSTKAGALRKSEAKLSRRHSVHEAVSVKKSTSSSLPSSPAKPEAARGRISGAAKEEVDSFVEMLKLLHLEQFTDGLRQLGIERASDVQYASDDDFTSIGMKPIQRKKLTMTVASTLPESAASTTPSFDSVSPDPSKLKVKRVKKASAPPPGVSGGGVVVPSRRASTSVLPGSQNKSK